MNDELISMSTSAANEEETKSHPTHDYAPAVFEIE